MSLSDALENARAAPRIAPTRAKAPTGWEPGVRYDPSTGQPTEVTTPPVTRDVQGKPEAWAALIAHLLPMVPEGHEVRLVEARYDPLAWSRDQQFAEHPDGGTIRGPATTRPAWRYRFRIVPSNGTHTAPVDLAELVKIVRGNRKVRARKVTTDRTRVVVLSDLQVGKVASGGGTAELLARIEDKVQQLEALFVEEPCDDLVIIDPGDLIENAFNVTSQLGTNDLSVPDQLRVARVILTEVIGRLSRSHSSTRVCTVGSNHGQWRIAQGAGGVAGRPGDDFGIDVHRAVAEAYSLAGRKDIAFYIPDPWQESIALQVRERCVIGVVHGHQWRAGKAAEWWKGQSLGDGPTAAAHILIHGHTHNAQMYQAGFLDGRPRWVISADALDGGSDWFTNVTGNRSEPSITTFVIGDDGRWDRYRRIVSTEG